MFFSKKILLLIIFSLSLQAQFFTLSNNHLDDVFNSFIDKFDIQYVVNTDISIAKLNVVENKNSYSYYFELAGFSKNDINITLENNYLIIKTSKRFQNLKKYKGIKSQEILSSSFYRNVKLPKNINLKNIDINYKNGILEVVFQKDFSKNINKIQTLKIN